MSDLQSAYYIIGIVFMSIFLIIGLIMVVALLVIRAKINAIHRHIEEKLATLSSIASKSSAVVDTLKKVTSSSKR